MRNLLRSVVLSLAVAGVPVCVSAADAPATQTGQANVPVKKVVLFSSGVGYFEHAGMVTGDSTTELRFKTNQINDLLKSLVLQDMDGGRVASVVYPSLDPVGRLLKSFQVDITGNPSLAELLNQLRGAKVKLTAGAENMAGTILGVEKKPKAVDRTTIEIWVLNLISGAVIRSVPLEEVTKLELEDPQLQEELAKALAALATARDQDKKPVTIHFNGQGERRVRMGYVVETPIWKTSYRLLLSRTDDKPMLQGWAIVENQTDNDWNEVQLGLVSGRPISFIQELYQPLYIPRPLVQPELYASLRPQTYEAGMEAEKARQQLASESRDARDNFAAAPGAPAAAGRGGGRGGATGGMGGGMGGGGFGGAPAAEAPPMDPAASVVSVASAAKIGELFEYTVGNVTLPRQRSAMLPIISDPVEVEKLSIYNASVLARNPLYGARVKNTTTKHLLQGPITVLEGPSYAGDARIDNVPPGQERLLSYGVDLQMVVNSTATRNESAVVTGKVVRGVLQLQRKNTFTQEYVAENKGDAAKVLIIEHPLRRNWKLVEPEKALETTDTLYRFRTTVPAGKVGTFTVREEIVTVETIALLSANTNAIETYTRTGAIPPAVRDALSRAIQMRQNLADLQRQIDEAKQQMALITQEQTRIRENIRTVPERGTLYNRLIEKLTEQEKQIDELFTKIETRTKEMESARAALEDYLTKLNVE